MLALLKPLNDGQARIRLKAERALNRRLEGGCQVPIAAYAVIEKDAEQSHQKHYGYVAVWALKTARYYLNRINVLS